MTRRFGCTSAQLEAHVEGELQPPWSIVGRRIAKSIEYLIQQV
jgi:hypothetical protein